MAYSWTDPQTSYSWACTGSSGTTTGTVIVAGAALTPVEQIREEIGKGAFFQEAAEKLKLTPALARAVWEAEVPRSRELPVACQACGGSGGPQLAPCAKCRGTGIKPEA